MTSRTIGTVLAHAVTDTDFREQLSEHPDEVLSELDLSATEIEALKSLDKTILDIFDKKSTEVCNCIICCITC